MEGAAIITEGLLKEYHIYDSPMERLKELFLKRAKHRVFKALGPMDVRIRKGEAFGIVGENGAGKSTFLKLISGVIEPSAGAITVVGKVSSILELGTGFNPEFTGRENVLLNASFYGFSSKEVHERMETIEGFADIGEFFDMPVKTYSSGMYMRLAFSLAVHVDAEVVVIDEALAVGDGAYEKKCIDKIWELKRNGAAILLCSHSLYTITNFCDRTIWLKKGRTEEIGDTKDVISKYEDYLREKENREKADAKASGNYSEKKITEIKDIRLMCDGRITDTVLPYGSNIDAIVDFEIFEDADVHIGFAIDRNDNLCCYADSMHKQGLKPFHGPGKHSAVISFKDFPLLDGTYKLVFFLLDETGICIFDTKESRFFRISAAEKRWGVCNIAHEWKI